MILFTLLSKLKNVIILEINTGEVNHLYILKSRGEGADFSIHLKNNIICRLSFDNFSLNNFFSATETSVLYIFVGYPFQFSDLFS